MILSLFLVSYCPTLQAEEDIVTDIILINGLAELVDLNHDGEVLQRYLSIPDYFSSGRSHKRTLRESLAKTKLFGLNSIDEESSESVAYNAPVECRQSLLRKANIEDQDYGDEGYGDSFASNTIQEWGYGSHISDSDRMKCISYRNENRNIVLRQRSLVDERFRRVALCFRSTSRTSKAIIDV